MCSRDCSTAMCWKWSSFAGSMRLKTPPTPFFASASVICPSESSWTCCSFSSTVILRSRPSTRRSMLRSAGCRVGCSAASSPACVAATTPPAEPSTATVAASTTVRPLNLISVLPPTVFPASVCVPGSRLVQTPSCRVSDRSVPAGGVLMRIRLTALAAAVLLAHAAPAQADAGPLDRYARDTWASFAAMTDPASGLPADILNADGSTSVQTSTTNIGAYMWSAVVAQRLGIIRRDELVARLTTTLGTLEHMKRYGSTGQFYNWYDHRTSAKLTVWPPD